MKTAIKFCWGSISGAQFDSLKKILDFGVFRNVLDSIDRRWYISGFSETANTLNFEAETIVFQGFRMAFTENLGENTDKNNRNILEFNVLAVFQQALI
jgi:hypothetical protein